MSDSGSIWHGRSKSLDETLAIGAAIARLASAGDVIALSGELGAGKTQFVRGMADGLSIGRMAVSSPTFVLSQEYDAAEEGGLRLVHIDAYRLEGALDGESIGLDGGDDLRKDAVVAIEWADRLPELIGDDCLQVEIEHEGEDSRILAITPRGNWVNRSDVMADSLKAFESPISVDEKSTPCPICEKDAMPSAQNYPFCSGRCRNVDLGRWLNGSYVISRPIEQADLEQDD